MFWYLMIWIGGVQGVVVGRFSGPGSTDFVQLVS